MCIRDSLYASPKGQKSVIFTREGQTFSFPANGDKKKKEMIAMPRHSFIQMTKLHNVMGRIDYITSTVKQENLYAIYATQPLRSFWKDQMCIRDSQME